MRMAQHVAAWAKADDVEIPLYSGVVLVGSSASIVDGIFSTTEDSSYGKLPFVFNPLDRDIEFVEEIETGTVSTSYEQGFFGGLGDADTFTPFYLRWNTLVPYIGTGGTSWNILTASTTLKRNVIPFTKYLFKFTYHNNTFTHLEYVNDKWVVMNKKNSNLHVGSGELQIGTNRGRNNHFRGRVNLNKCYIRLGGELLWEGIVGAHKNVPM